METISQGNYPVTPTIVLQANAEFSGVGEVILPGEQNYAAAMSRLFSSEAAMTRPHCIVRPRTVAEVAAAVRIARDSGQPITVRSGSHSALCASDGAVMIDMSAQFGQVVVDGDEALVGGGAMMGSVLEALGEHSRLIPVGVAKTPGLGLALQGGVGHLTRSLGLTLDSIREVELVTASGSVLRLNEESAGDEADLWWAVRGCAPNFGIVTSIRVRTFATPVRVYAERLVFPLDALPTFFDLTRELPRSICASAVIGPPPDSFEPVLFVYLVYAGDDSPGIQKAQELTRALTRSAGTKPLLQHGDRYFYCDMPAMDVPPLAGFPPTTPLEAPATSPRIFTFKKSPFLNGLDPAAAKFFINAIRSAPTSLCRIDLQHCGGAMGDVAPDATGFWNRGMQWNCPIIGAWTDTEKHREACTEWVRQTKRSIGPYVAGTYCVEILPGLPETAAEVREAFGANLPRLQKLKRKWDPERVFRSYYPIELD